MTRREEWQQVLATELGRWAAKPWRQLLSDLEDGNVAYEVVCDGKTYQVEIDRLEDTQEYLNVSVAVDDGSLPESICPESRNFICRKTA